ncbi:hypothetical protein DERF_010500 [Dermatophagoides farinae]|uniref:Uncharacterized protein n=1 Tax=Dermatophagoides farinae TaxID=6954 RepID=A0A922L701_DERFA|nr:hypothetical protein DERF_010500 [Dermatophagoides farinae]
MECDVQLQQIRGEFDNLQTSQQNLIDKLEQHVRHKQQQIKDLNEECKILKKSNVDKEQFLHEACVQLNLTENEFTKLLEKYKTSQGFISILQNRLDHHKESRKKLINDLTSMMEKIDSNKQDSIKNKTILENMNERKH